MSWDSFIIFAIFALVLWTTGAWAAWKEKKNAAYVATGLGLAVFFTFIIGLWISLERPPLRTMGETRLWYSLFLPMDGMLVYSRWEYKWILSFSTILAAVFIIINLLKPEIHNKTLMPALQSPWFAPHVIVYMMAYALLGAAFVMAIYMLWTWRRQGKTQDKSNGEERALLNRQGMKICDNLVYVGWSFLTIGMLLGALWAKEAWGTYWSWDPKETWAAATWLAYLIYIHHRLRPKGSHKFALWVLIVNFALLQMCWWGINYLPSAKGSSIHTYSIS